MAKRSKKDHTSEKIAFFKTLRCRRHNSKNETNAFLVSFKDGYVSACKPSNFVIMEKRQGNGRAHACLQTASERSRLHCLARYACVGVNQ
jgi:hypothetical protein